MNWTIIGCGWLGTSLGEILVKKVNEVIGTTTSNENSSSLTEKGIKHYSFQLYSQISNEIIDNSEVVIISIPPFDRNKPTKYGESLVHLVQQFNPKTKFIFLSSTGVYPQKDGVFDENYDFESDEKLTSLLQAEKQLSEYLKKRLTILRLGGLFGDNRHPVFSLSGKTNVKNPEGKINFVGKNDVISIIQEIVNQNKFGETYNIVFPKYPKRIDYYSLKAKELGIIAPEFETSQKINRKISSQKVQISLNYKFKHEI